MLARDLETFITRNLMLAPARGLPEINLWQATPGSRLRRLASASGGRSPYWAYGWAGGAVLARYVLDKPETVAGLRVLDLGCGGGLVAIAAAKAGAAKVTCVDIDPAAIAATSLNAAANDVRPEARLGDLLDGPSPDVDIILVGDLFYARHLATRTAAYLARCRTAGVAVLVGDPYRKHLPLTQMKCLAQIAVPDFGGGIRVSGVFAFEPQPPPLIRGEASSTAVA